MHTDIFTYFTKTNGETELVYSSEDWVRVTLRLQTAGPVAASTRQDIRPVLSGRGNLLPTDDELEFILPKGDRLFLIAESVNRIAIQVEPVPWLQQILMGMDKGFGAMVSAVFRLKDRGRAPRLPKPEEKAPVPCPPGMSAWK